MFMIKMFMDCFGKKLIYSWKWVSLNAADRHHNFVHFLAIALWSAALLMAACERKAPEATSLLEKPTVTNMSEPFVRGEIVVKFKPSIVPARVNSILKQTHTEVIAQFIGTTIYHVRIVSDEPVESVLQNLSVFQEIEYAEPNYISQLQKKPQ